MALLLAVLLGTLILRHGAAPPGAVAQAPSEAQSQAASEAQSQAPSGPAAGGASSVAVTPAITRAITRSITHAAAPAPTASASAPAGQPALSMAQWLAGHSADWRVARLQENPAVLVIEFPSLAAQGAAMNRIAALLEKAGAPRDRVLGDAELAALIDRAGDNAQTFYQGHDYDGGGLARFFTLAQRQGLRLGASEQRLRRLLLDQGVLAESPEGLRAPGLQALISFSATQADDPTTPLDETVDDLRRDSVLRHESSHGRYYTRPVYRAHCHRFWHEVLSAAQREAMRSFLGGLGYDRSNEELMVNETQAMMMNTPDERAFNAQAVGMAPAVLEGLRARFWRSLPPDTP